MTAENRACSTCGTTKPPTEYPRDKGAPGGFGYRCKACDRLRKQAARGTLVKHTERAALAGDGKKRCAGCNEVKSRDGFRPKKGASDGLQSWCIVCQNEASKEHARRKAPAVKAARKEAAKTRPPNPPALTSAEKTARWKEKDPEHARATQRRYMASPGGKLRHRLTSSRRRARMNGVVTPAEWFLMLVAWGHRCAYCRAEIALTIDHVVPVSVGGVHDITNVVPACKRCNDTKNDAPLDEALERLGVDAFRWKSRRWFATQNALALG